MSRSSRPGPASSTTIITPIHPAHDRDIVMGPPPPPAQIAPASSLGARSKDGENQDVTEKYRRLKRKYFELEEKHKDTNIELRSSGERAVQWRSERSALLDRIVELEAATIPGQHPPPHPLLPHPASTAYPRSLNNPHAQKRFHMNLERALAEAEYEDPSTDPILASRHVGPNARRRLEAEMKERMEEEVREARRAARRPRGGRGKEKERERAPEPARDFVREQGRALAVRGERDRERERLERAERDRDGAGPPLTLAPPPGAGVPFQGAPSPQQVVVSSNGTRLRIKPPAPPGGGHYMDVDSPPRREREVLPPREMVMQDQGMGMGMGMGRHETMGFPRGHLVSPPLQETSRVRQEAVHLPPPPPEPLVSNQQVPGPSRVHIRGGERRSASPPPRMQSPPPDAMDEDRVPFNQTPNPAQSQSVSISSPAQQRTEVIVAPPAQVQAQGQGQTPASMQNSAQTPPAAPGPKSPIQPTHSPATKYRQVAAAPPPPPQATMPPPLRPRAPPSVPSPQPVPSASVTASAGPMSVTANPQIQVYPVTAPGSGLLGRGGDPMGPNGAAAAMMQTFNPIMHPISAGGGQGPGTLARNKPKRLKAHTVTSKSFSIPVVPRDKKGRPVLPLVVGIMTVVCLGQICMREHFHTERYIFPVGYEVKRRYLSTTDPNADCVYRCTILDGGDGPKFQIIAEDQPDKPIIAGTATGAWSVVVRAANHMRNRQHSNSVSGPDFFGLGQNSIKHLIQELPNASKLKDYVWQKFVEGGHLFVHENRQLGGGRHQSALPADDQDDAEAGDGTPAAPSYYTDDAHELQIIQVPPPDGSAPPLAMKPLQFHQEYPDREPPPRESTRGRRASVHDTYERDDERARPHHAPSPAPAHPPTPSHAHSHAHSNSNSNSNSNSHSNSHSTHSTHSHSPALSPRASHSPVMPREREREPYSPQAHRSPYQSPPLAQQAQAVPAVPPTFANIMNAYPAPPLAAAHSAEPASPYEGRRRSIANAGGVER